MSEYPCIRDKPAGGGASERTTTSKHEYSDAFSQTFASETLPLRVGHAKRTTSRGSVPPLPWETQLSSRTARRVSLSPNITLQRESGKRHTAIDPLHTFPVHTNFGETVLLSHSCQELVPVQKRHVYVRVYKDTHPIVVLSAARSQRGAPWRSGQSVTCVTYDTVHALQSLLTL